MTIIFLTTDNRSDEEAVMQSREVYTITQLAQRWQCSTDAIYDMVRRGDIKSFRVGKAIRFTAEAVAEYEKR